MQLWPALLEVETLEISAEHNGRVGSKIRRTPHVFHCHDIAIFGKRDVLHGPERSPNFCVGINVVHIDGYACSYKRPQCFRVFDGEFTNKTCTRFKISIVAETILSVCSNTDLSSNRLFPASSDAEFAQEYIS